MKKNIDISVIVPVYKVEKYIGECLSSVIGQTKSKNVECILVDDCGGDKSISIVRNIIDEYKGDISFKVLCHNQNKGLSAARNTAIHEAIGSYVFFLDSDDCITPNCLADLWSLVEKYPNVDIVQAFLYRDGTDPNSHIKHFCPTFMKNRKVIRYGFCRFLITDAGCNRLVRRDFLVNNNIFFKEGYTQEDTIWSFDIQKYVKSIAHCFKYTYYYRETPNSIMTSLTNETTARDFARVFNLALEKTDDGRLDYCEVFYFSLLAFRVHKANPSLCSQLIPSMKSSLFKSVVMSYYIRNNVEENILKRAFAEAKILILSYVISRKGLIKSF